MIVMGCGRYAPPLPPEAFSPQAVRFLEARTESTGVRILWRSPDRDVRGEELRSLDGYLVERRDFGPISTAETDDVEYETLARLEDPQLEILARLRDEARAQGLPTRRVKVDEENTKFEYLDTAVNPGTLYVYRITPINQGGVEGQVAQVVRVLYQPEAGSVAVLDRDAEIALDEILPVSEKSSPTNEPSGGVGEG